MNKKLFAATRIRLGQPLTVVKTLAKDGPDWIFTVGIRKVRGKDRVGPLGYATRDYEVGDRIFEVGDSQGHIQLVRSAADHVRFSEGPPPNETPMSAADIHCITSGGWADTSSATPLSDMTEMKKRLAGEWLLDWASSQAKKGKRP